MSHSEIVKKAGTPQEVAEAHGVSVHTVRSWIQRGSIPPEHWREFVNAGHATIDELLDARGDRKTASDTPQASAA